MLDRNAAHVDITSRIRTAEPASVRPKTKPVGCEEQNLQNALTLIERTMPEFSAARTAWTWQVRALISGIGAVTVALVLAPATTLAVMFAVLSVPFLCVALLRIVAICHLTKKQTADAFYTEDKGTAAKFSDAELPTYSVLIPLFDEAHVIPNLLAAMRAIDYPDDKIEFIFITERIDNKTRVALTSETLNDNMRVVTVPNGKPRTKPRAMDYALQSARGDIVTVYDAEDMPEPDQLRKAAAHLQNSKGQTGCIQARLNIYNARDCWLTRQFTIEYTSLFDALLPALHMLKIPIPLGGTSNHFPRRALNHVRAWDPYNVTEDADLGIRFARFGYTVDLIDSTTWEEAPATFHEWLGQRTRWNKGFMQTYLVHMRQPRRTARELGSVSFIGLQILMAGLILSPLIHPWFLIALGSDFALSSIDPTRSAILAPASWLYWIGITNMALGYGVAIALGGIAVAKRGWRDLTIHALTMPLYWLLISLGAHRALIELITAPHHWQKTTHAQSRPWQIPTGKA